MLTLGASITAQARGQTLHGTIIKMKRKTCDVQVTGGDTRFRVGMTVNVPYAIITGAKKYGDNGMEEGESVNATAIANLFQRNVQTPTAPPKTANEYNKMWVEIHRHELCILMGIYSCLSPENLTCDGECSAEYVRQRKAALNRKMDAIRVLLDNDVPDEEICWQLIQMYPDIFKK